MNKNISVIGCGAWGKNLIRNFHNLDALYAICDIDLSRIDLCKQDYPGLVTHSSYDLLLKDPKVDAIAIATPASTHYAIAKQALSSGKDVMVEKPLALNYEEAEELVNLARGTNQILMTGHVLIYHPAVGKLKQLINEGELGKIYYIYSNRLNLGKFRTEENILWSFAPHDVSAVLYLLGEMPTSVSAMGGNYLRPHIADVTMTSFSFASGVKAHIFVSWLHPYKEQKLVIIGDKKMVLFDDVNSGKKLLVYDHKIDWIGRSPVPKPEEPRTVEVGNKEPLLAECEHFIDCIRARKVPVTDGEEGLRVLKILGLCQLSLEEKGKTLETSGAGRKSFFIHETSRIDDLCEIGEGTKIWYFSHILKNCKIGKNCVLGQNVSVGPNVLIGNNVKIQNNVSIYEGVTLEDDVFCGPSMVFTNVINPRSHKPRKDEFQKTLVKKGASLGANSTIICGVTIGQYAFIGAGAVVKKDVPDFAIVYGTPARIQGWMCNCGIKLSLSNSPNSEENSECKSCGKKYKKQGLVVKEM